MPGIIALHKKIRKLPNLSLGKEEYDYFFKILGGLKENNEKAFDTDITKAFSDIIDSTDKEKIGLSKKSISKIKKYLKKWQNLKTNLLAWMALVDKIYQETTREENLKVDDFVPLIRMFRPPTSEDLPDLRAQLKKAIEIDPNSQFAYYLTTLYVALEEVSEKNFANEAKREQIRNEKLLNVLNEITKFDKLLSIFTNYKNYLLSLIFNKSGIPFSLEYKIESKYALSSILKDDAKEDLFIQNVQQQINSLHLKSESDISHHIIELETLTNDFLKVKSIYYILTANINRSYSEQNEKLIFVKNQFDEYKDELAANVYSQSSLETLTSYVPGNNNLKKAAEYIRLDKISYFFIMPTKQQQFLSSAEKLLNGTQEKEVLHQESTTKDEMNSNLDSRGQSPSNG